MEKSALVSIGWILAADERDEAVLAAYRQAAHRVLTNLSEQFPQFHWEMPFVKRGQFAPLGALNPLPLLELGVQEKLHQVWDYALVLVPNELHAKDRVSTIGIPSSALEVAVISTARLNNDQGFVEQLAGLALHLLGHMWGLEHTSEGPMTPPEDCDQLCVDLFSSEQQAVIVDRLEEVADARLEEQQKGWGWFAFHWHTFWADPSGILIDIFGYKPWRLPFRMPRLTAAAAVSIVFLLLGAEAWEVGVNFSPLALALGALGSVLASTTFIYFGQNLSQISREVGRREQLTRTRMVLFYTLLLGMSALWLVLFVVSFLAAAAVPQDVPRQWLDISLGGPALARYAAFMAILGILAAALGGNLEEESDMKARLFFDEET